MPSTANRLVRSSPTDGGTCLPFFSSSHPRLCEWTLAGKKPDRLIGLRGMASHRIRLNSGGTGQVELGKVMKVIVGRIHRYVHRHPGNDRYGCERYPVSEPPRSDEAGRKRLHGSRTDVTCLFLAGKTEPGGASRRAFIVEMMVRSRQINERRQRHQARSD